MKPQSRFGFTRLVAAFGNSLAGLRAAWRREAAFRFESVLFLFSVPTALWISSSLGEFGLLVGSILALLIVEIINSALEAIVDRIGLERHELSRVAKDLGSAAVLLAVVFPASIWGLALLRHFGLVTL